jgi:hypothetical protein
MPFRTFRELDQPEGEFLLRLRSGAGDLPMVALYQAEGIAWELTAIESIHSWLADRLPDHTIVR